MEPDVLRVHRPETLQRICKLGKRRDCSKRIVAFASRSQHRSNHSDRDPPSTASSQKLLDLSSGTVRFLWRMRLGTGAPDLASLIRKCQAQADQLTAFSNSGVSVIAPGVSDVLQRKGASQFIFYSRDAAVAELHKAEQAEFYMHGGSKAIYTKQQSSNNDTSSSSTWTFASSIPAEQALLHRQTSAEGFVPVTPSSPRTAYRNNAVTFHRGSATTQHPSIPPLKQLVPQLAQQIQRWQLRAQPITPPDDLYIPPRPATPEPENIPGTLPSNPYPTPIPQPEPEPIQPAAYQLFTTQQLLQLSYQKAGTISFYRSVRVGHPYASALTRSVHEISTAVAAVASELSELADYQLAVAGELLPVLQDSEQGCALVEVPLLAVLEGFKVHQAVVAQRDGSSVRFRLRVWADDVTGASGAMARGPCWRWEGGRFSS